MKQELRETLDQINLDLGTGKLELQDRTGNLQTYHLLHFQNSFKRKNNIPVSVLEPTPAQSVKDPLQISFSDKASHEYSQNYDDQAYSIQVIEKRRLRKRRMIILQIFWFLCLFLTRMTLGYEVLYIAVLEDEVEF